MSVLKFKNASYEWQNIMTIEGAPGPQGPAPIKGEDYWTESEKKDLVNEIKAEIKIPDVSQFKTATEIQAMINASLSAIGVAEEGAY